MANSVDPDQTAPIRCLLLYLLISNVRHLFATGNFSRRHFQMHFFLVLVNKGICLQARLSVYPLQQHAPP